MHKRIYSSHARLNLETTSQTLGDLLYNLRESSEHGREFSIHLADAFRGADPLTNKELAAVGRLRYAHECKVRDVFAECLSQLRPDERIVKKELRYSTAARRVDMRTVDRAGTLRDWEFKIYADHRTLGQLLVYLSHARREVGFRPVRGVIAAFSIPDELKLAVEVMSLNIELVTIPAWMRAAGSVPPVANFTPVPTIFLKGVRTK